MKGAGPVNGRTAETWGPLQAKQTALGKAPGERPQDGQGTEVQCREGRVLSLAWLAKPQLVVQIIVTDS